MTDAPALARPGASAAGWLAARGAAASLALTALSAALMTIRVVERGEIWLDRTYALVGIAAFGGCCAALGTLLALAVWQPGSPRLPRWAIAVLSFGTLLVGAMLIGYLVHFLLLGGQFEPRPNRALLGVPGAVLQLSALFLVSIPAYLLPWPLPVLLVAAAMLLPRAMPKAVERARTAV